MPVEYHQRALPLQVAHDARDTALRRDRQQHVHVVEHQAPLDYLDPLVLAQLPEDLPYVAPDLAADHLAPILRREHDVVPVHPLRVGKAVGLLGHGGHPFDSRILDGPNNRQYRSEGWLCKAVCLHPHSG